jgi:hypothetical protein
MLRLVICYLLLLSPAIAMPIAWAGKPMPDRQKLGPVLQKAVGADWTVAATSGGYILTSRKVYSLLPDVSSNTKLNFNQRMIHARRTHLVIKVLFTAADMMHQKAILHPGDAELPIVKAERASGYFLCFPPEDDEDAYDQYSLRVGPNYAVFLFTNISPYESIQPPESDIYLDALEPLGQVFGVDPFSIVE